MTTQADAIQRVKSSERRYNVTRLLLFLLLLLTFFIYVGFIVKITADKITREGIATRQKIDESDNANRHFYCSMAISLLHSDQTIEDCIAKNGVAEAPAPKVTAPDEGAIDFQLLNDSNPTPEQEMAVTPSQQPQNSPQPIDNGGNGDNPPEPSIIESIITTIKGLLP